MEAIGYIRVSTGEQAQSGAGLTAQQDSILREVKSRRWNLVDIYAYAGVSGSTLKREGLSTALAAIENGGADTLVVAKLDRLSRSLLDFAALMERSRQKGWAVVALDVGVDTTTPNGEMVANVMVTFAQFERRLIGQRTKDALAVKRAEECAWDVLAPCQTRSWMRSSAGAGTVRRSVPLQTTSIAGD